MGGDINRYGASRLSFVATRYESIFANDRAAAGYRRPVIVPGEQFSPGVVPSRRPRRYRVITPAVPVAPPPPVAAPPKDKFSSAWRFLPIQPKFARTLAIRRRQSGDRGHSSVSVPRFQPVLVFRPAQWSRPAQGRSPQRGRTDAGGSCCEAGGTEQYDSHHSARRIGRSWNGRTIEPEVETANPVMRLTVGEDPKAGPTQTRASQRGRIGREGNRGRGFAIGAKHGRLAGLRGSAGRGLGW